MKPPMLAKPSGVKRQKCRLPSTSLMPAHCFARGSGCGVPGLSGTLKNSQPATIRVMPDKTKNISRQLAICSAAFSGVDAASAPGAVSYTHLVYWAELVLYSRSNTVLSQNEQV